MAGVPVPDDMIVISKKEYEQLKDESAFLAALRSAGVDNWGGYDYAIRIANGEEDW